VRFHRNFPYFRTRTIGNNINTTVLEHGKP
jgi:hypothetical protein